MVKIIFKKKIVKILIQEKNLKNKYNKNIQYNKLIFPLYKKNNIYTLLSSIKT